MAFRGDDLGFLEARVEGELLHELGAFRHADVLGRDRGLVDPLLEPRDGFVVASGDLVVDGAELALGEGGRAWVAAQSAALLAAVWVTKSRRVYLLIAVSSKGSKGTAPST